MRKYLLILFLYPALVNSQVVPDTTVYISNEGDTLKVLTYQKPSVEVRDSMGVARSLIAAKATGTGTASGTNTGDNATNTQYSGLAASKENTITAGTTAQYWRGDKSWQTLDKTAVGLGNVSNSLQLVAANNLNDLTNAGTARTNIGLGNVTNESKATMFSSPTFTGTVSGITATMVGLGNVTNESKATMFTSPTFTGTVTLPASTSLTTPVIGVATGTSLAVTGSITSSGGGIGYATGNGGAVTQLTNKATTVVLNKLSGEITMNAAALAAATIVSFTLTNSTIAATDVLILNHVTTGTRGAYTLNAQCAAGSAVIYIRNNTAGSLGEAIVIRFVTIKSVVN